MNHERSLQQYRCYAAVTTSASSTPQKTDIPEAKTSVPSTASAAVVTVIVLLSAFRGLSKSQASEAGRQEVKLPAKHASILSNTLCSTVQYLYKNLLGPTWTRGSHSARLYVHPVPMRASGTFIAATSAISSFRSGYGFVHVSGFAAATACGHDRPSTCGAFKKRSRLNKRGSCSPAVFGQSSTAVRAADEEVLLTFKPSEVQVGRKVDRILVGDAFAWSCSLCSADVVRRCDNSIIQYTIRMGDMFQIQ